MLQWPESDPDVPKTPSQAIQPSKPSTAGDLRGAPMQRAREEEYWSSDDEPMSSLLTKRDALRYCSHAYSVSHTSRDAQRDETLRQPITDVDKLESSNGTAGSPLVVAGGSSTGSSSSHTVVPTPLSLLVPYREASPSASEGLSGRIQTLSAPSLTENFGTHPRLRPPSAANGTR